VAHRYIFDYREGDIHGCLADIGWITGHSFIVNKENLSIF
jgi:acetyl-CoA synthetase